MAKKNVSGVNVEMSSDELNELKKAQDEAKKLWEDEIDIKTKKEADRTSGNKKLKDLGLTEDEINALTN